MNKIQWYEIFVSTNDGTQTVMTCDTAKEARYYRKKFTANKLPNEEFFIDKWEDTENPHIIGEIN